MKTNLVDDRFIDKPPTNILTVALVIKDQEKTLPTFIPEVLTYADQIVALDDGSKDNTQKIMEDFAKKHKNIFYYRNNESTFWEAENELRSFLWTDILPRHDQDWVLAIDTDEEMDKRFPAVKDQMMAQDEVNGYYFQFWEFWGDKKHVRIDRGWNPVQKQMLCMVRWLPQVNYQWSPAALHGGRTPINSPEPLIPSGLHIKHYGWSIPENEQRMKFKKYMERDPNPHPMMKQHYYSIVYGDKQFVEWYFD